MENETFIFQKKIHIGEENQTLRGVKGQNEAYYETLGIWMWGNPTTVKHEPEIKIMMLMYESNQLTAEKKSGQKKPYK